MAARIMDEQESHQQTCYHGRGETQKSSAKDKELQTTKE